jgi:hypothetical protein
MLDVSVTPDFDPMAVTDKAFYVQLGARIAVALLPPLAQHLGVSVEELIGTATRRSGKRGPTPRFQQQIERLSTLPQSQQRLVMQMLDGVIAQAGR